MHIINTNKKYITYITRRNWFLFINALIQEVNKSVVIVIKTYNLSTFFITTCGFLQIDNHRIIFLIPWSFQLNHLFTVLQKSNINPFKRLPLIAVHR